MIYNGTSAVEVLFTQTWLIYHLPPRNLPHTFSSTNSQLPFCVNPPFSICSPMLVHHKTPYTIPPLQTAIPWTVIYIFLCCWITIISIYLSPSIDFLKFETLLSQLQLQPPLLIDGDFNCCPTLWGDSIINPLAMVHL